MSFDLVSSADGYFRTFPWPTGKIFSPFFFSERANQNFLNNLEQPMISTDQSVVDQWYTNLFVSKLKYTLFDVLSDIANDNSDRMNRIMSYNEYSFVSNVHTITYMPNGATSGTPPVDTGKYTPTSNITIMDNTGAMTNGTLSFNGWNTSADGSGSSFSVGSKLIIGQNDVVLYAMWSTTNTSTPTNNITQSNPQPNSSNPASAILAIGNLNPGSVSSQGYNQPYGGYFAPTETDELMYQFEYPRTWSVSNIAGPYFPNSSDFMLETNLDLEASFASDFSSAFNGDMDNGDLNMESYHAYFDSGAWNAFPQNQVMNPNNPNNPMPWNPNSVFGRNVPPSQIIPAYQLPTGWNTYPPNFIRNDPIANGYWIYVPANSQVTLPRSMMSAAKFVSPSSVSSIVSIFFLFYEPEHQAIFPEFTSIAEYLLSFEPSRRNISLLDRIGVESSPSPQVMATPIATTPPQFPNLEPPIQTFENQVLVDSQEEQPLGYSPAENITIENPPTNTSPPVPTTPFVPPTQTPTASGSPTNVSVEPADSQVTIMWTPVTGVIGYNIYRSDVEGENGPRINILLNTTTTYIDMDLMLVNGQNYYYSVTAITAEQDIGDYFDPTDSLVEDTTVIQEFAPSFLVGSVCESNVQTWIRAIKNFVSQNPTLFNGIFNIPTTAQRTAVGYDPTPMVTLWKLTIQAIELLFGFTQELMMTQTRFTKRYEKNRSNRSSRQWRP